MTIFKPIVVPLAQKSGEICTGQFILQPILLKSDRLLNRYRPNHFKIGCHCARSCATLDGAISKIDLPSNAAVT